MMRTTWGIRASDLFTNDKIMFAEVSIFNTISLSKIQKKLKKNAVKITDFAFSRKLSRKLPLFSSRNFRENENKVSQKFATKPFFNPSLRINKDVKSVPRLFTVRRLSRSIRAAGLLATAGRPVSQF
jgi:hypothetical protein